MDASELPDAARIEPEVWGRFSSHTLPSCLEWKGDTLPSDVPDEQQLLVLSDIVGNLLGSYKPELWSPVLLAGVRLALIIKNRLPKTEYVLCPGESPYLITMVAKALVGKECVFVHFPLSLSKMGKSGQKMDEKVFQYLDGVFAPIKDWSHVIWVDFVSGAHQTLNAMCTYFESRGLTQVVQDIQEDISLFESTFLGRLVSEFCGQTPMPTYNMVVHTCLLTRDFKAADSMSVSLSFRCSSPGPGVTVSQETASTLCHVTLYLLLIWFKDLLMAAWESETPDDKRWSRMLTKEILQKHLNMVARRDEMRWWTGLSQRHLLRIRYLTPSLTLSEYTPAWFEESLGSRKFVLAETGALISSSLVFNVKIMDDQLPMKFILYRADNGQIVPLGLQDHVYKSFHLDEDITIPRLEIQKDRILNQNDGFGLDPIEGWYDISILNIEPDDSSTIKEGSVFGHPTLPGFWLTKQFDVIPYAHIRSLAILPEAAIVS